MNVVLIGYRGAGKSAVGTRVAKRLGMQYVSMDAMIADKAGVSIPEFVQTHGWPAFRDLETVVAREVAALDGAVIDTGGGVVERPENIEVLRHNGVIFWLKASVQTIVSRIRGDTERPALTAGKTFTDEVAEVLQRRTASYAGAAQHEIETDQLDPEQVVEMIVAVFSAAHRGGAGQR